MSRVESLEEEQPTRAQGALVNGPQLALQVEEIQDDVEGPRRQVEAVEVSHHCHQVRQAALRLAHGHIGDVRPDHTQAALQQKTGVPAQAHGGFKGKALPGKQGCVLGQ